MVQHPTTTTCFFKYTTLWHNKVKTDPCSEHPALTRMHDWRNIILENKCVGECEDKRTPDVYLTRRLSKGCIPQAPPCALTIRFSLLRKQKGNNEVPLFLRVGTCTGSCTASLPQTLKVNWFKDNRIAASFPLEIFLRENYVFPQGKHASLHESCTPV